MKKTTSPVDRFKAFSREYIPLIDSSMRDFFQTKMKSAEHPVISEMYGLLEEFCVREGKRIRPLVLLISCFGYGGGRKHREAILIASVLEIFHSFLLVQDDIIDRAELRRGGKALHLICGDRYGSRSHNRHIGSDIALILGDVLFADALEIVCESGMAPRLKEKVMKILAGTLEVTAWGQILDILHSNSKKIESPRETAVWIAMMKTAHYTVYYPLLMGYLLAGKNSEREMNAIREFSLPLGLAFQIRDDLLGVFGIEDDTGKSSDSDILEGKVTILVDATIEKLERRDRERFMALFTRRKKNARDVRRIRMMMAASGSREAAVERHGELIERSREMLAGLVMADRYRKVLGGLVELIEKI
ncbi:MAG: hypothetical protein A2176_01295 [Spirochaetes bacterium RBG_13_51_14]|nr:MAG: hypothetical protein A2176_01295 [Spirochaetes bacterium RBG_13_51_14]